MSLRCYFDADGWLRGPIAITHMTSPNHYTTGFAAKARGIVQHTEDGYEAGTIATFMNPDSEVSAFFAVAEDGAAQQFLPVGRGFVAWAQEAGNPYFRSCEFEDKTKTGVPMPPPQLTAGAQIIEACSAYDEFPLQITDNVNGTGLICHSDGGNAWGGHFSCPGDVRKAQRPQIIALAMSIRSGGAPAPQEGWTQAMIAGLPTLQQGNADQPGAPFLVHRMQALIACIGQINQLHAAAALVVDGNFGPSTAAALVACQEFFGIPGGGGQCGARSWEALVTGSWS
jgi:hypothetical protein